MADETIATPEAETTTPSAPAPKSNHLLETAADGPDPDQVELDEAIAAEKAEAEAAAAEPGATPSPTPTPAPEPSATPSPAPAAEPAMVPVAAVQSERHARQEAERLARQSTESAAYWKGVAEGKLPDPRIQGTPEAERSPADENIRALKSQQKDLAAKVDEGTLSNAEYEEQRQALQDQLDGIRDEKIKSEVLASMPKSSNDLYLETVSAKIEQDNPWLVNVPNVEIQDAIPGAKRDLAAAGVNLTALAGTPQGDFKLREAVVARLKKQGFDTQYAASPAPSPAPSGTPSPSSVPTKEQLDEKTRLAAAAPPTPAGTTAPANTWTPERVESMSSLDLENMPMSQLKQVGESIDRQTAAHRVSTGVRK